MDSETMKKAQCYREKYVPLGTADFSAESSFHPSVIQWLNVISPRFNIDAVLIQNSIFSAQKQGISSRCPRAVNPLFRTIFRNSRRFRKSAIANRETKNTISMNSNLFEHATAVPWGQRRYGYTTRAEDSATCAL